MQLPSKLIAISPLLPCVLATAMTCGSARAAIAWVPSSVREVFRSKGDFYCYAPNVVRDSTVTHYWFCRNADTGVIRDHVYYLRQQSDHIDPLRLALSPSKAQAWDQFHICDPSVVGGRFHRNGKEYTYAMFYLGNNVDACANNQVGVAFAKHPAGPWERHPKALVPYPQQGHWGVGQPSAINLDGRGHIALFYTKSDPAPAGYMREVVFEPDRPPQVGEEIRLPTTGLVRTDGRPDHLNNFDVAYDEARKRYLVIREVHPYPKTDPNFISTTLELVSIPIEAVRDRNAHWTREAIIDPALTNHPRNHNAGIEKTWSGSLPDPNTICVVFTVSCAEPDCAGKPLWSYGLWEVTGKISR